MSYRTADAKSRRKDGSAGNAIMEHLGLVSYQRICEKQQAGKIDDMLKTCGKESEAKAESTT